MSHLDSPSDFPEHIIVEVQKMLSAAKKFRGPQARYLMYDYVAMAKGALHLRSQCSGCPLSEIRNSPQYANWSQTDFELFLVCLKVSDYLGKLISHVTTEVEKDMGLDY